jgi:aryl-alcohol dehydrogenase-like predicted oxidoreductase
VSKAASLPTRRLGPFQVSAVGLGCMNFSHGYGQKMTPEQARPIIEAALDAGTTLFDTAMLYGNGHNETLLSQILVADHRDQIVLCSKGGMVAEHGPEGYRRRIDSKPQTIVQNCHDSLQRLKTDVLDLYYLHRWDKVTPIEDVVGAMGRLVEQGKVRTIGLSEVSAATLQKAHAVHPITAVQSEYSLWTRNPEIALLQACEDLGVQLVAFSPVGRGFLTDDFKGLEALASDDLRQKMPRFQAPAIDHNRALVAPLQAQAASLGMTTAQLALTWLLGKSASVIPIPGTTSAEHARQNAAAAGLVLSPEDWTEVDACIGQHNVMGGRYDAAAQAGVDTENF